MVQSTSTTKLSASDFGALPGMFRLLSASAGFCALILLLNSNNNRLKLEAQKADLIIRQKALELEVNLTNDGPIENSIKTRIDDIINETAADLQKSHRLTKVSFVAFFILGMAAGAMLAKSYSIQKDIDFLKRFEFLERFKG